MGHRHRSARRTAAGWGLLGVLLALSSPLRAEPAPRQSRRVPLEQVVRLLHSDTGHQLATQALHQARADQRAGRTGRFERRLLRDAKRLKALDRKRQRYAGPDSRLNWQRWNLRPLRQRAPTSVLNALGAGLVIEQEPYLPRPVKGPARQVPYLDLDRLEQRLGKGASQLVESLMQSEEGKRLARGQPVGDISWWTALNGVRGRMANALSDRASLEPYMPGLSWAVKEYGSLDGKLKGALVRWPLRGNTLALLADTGLPLSNTVVYADKDHFTDPRVVIAAKKLDRGLAVRGVKVDHDRAFIEKWIRTNIASLTPAEKRSQRPLFLVSDDGSYLSRAVIKVFEQQPDLQRYRHLFAGVEQTASGANKLAKVKLPFRIVNWARSEQKTYSGSLMWSYAVVSQAARNVERLRAKGVEIGRDKVVVLGAGSMGRAATHWLRYMGFKQIELWDHDPKRRAQYHLRDDKIDVIADADVVISLTAGNRALGPETLRELVARGKKPKRQLWLTGGSPGEIGDLSARSLRPKGLKTDKRGVLTAMWEGRRIDIGRRSDGPDRDRFIEHEGWKVVSLRDGRVINGQSPVGGVRHSLFTKTGAMYYGEYPLDPRTNDPVTGYAIQFELAMMHLAHLHAVGLTDEKDGRRSNESANLVQLPAGQGARQDRMVHATKAMGTNLMILEDLQRKGTFFIW